jgi:hypothetical protein
MFKKYGTMYISQKYICFESNVFGMNSQEVIPLAKVVGIELKKKDLKVSLKSKKYTFVIENNPEEINSLLASLLQGIKAQASPSDRDEEEPGSSLSLKHSNTRNMSKDATAMSLTPQDWQLLMQGFKLVTYVKDEVVVQVGVAHSRIYQIAKGSFGCFKIPAICSAELTLTPTSFQVSAESRLAPQRALRLWAQWRPALSLARCHYSRAVAPLHQSLETMPLLICTFWKVTSSIFSSLDSPSWQDASLATLPRYVLGKNNGLSYSIKELTMLY